jgi:hypothetical protein
VRGNGLVLPPATAQPYARREGLPRGCWKQLGKVSEIKDKGTFVCVFQNK